MTVVENISWSELLKSTNLTAQHGNDGNRIATATESLKQTAHQFTQVLNERAILFANSAQFGAALHDAAAIRALLPGSGLGYLCTGDVHCQQGRYAAAISIYDQGLETVPDTDAYYQQLQQHRLAAIANNNKRVDFINELPLDIVISHIVSRIAADLGSNELYEPLYVSRAWQERILQRPDGLDFALGQEWVTLKNGHDQLVRFAPYIRRISGSIKNGIHLDDLLSRAHFSNLKRLDLFYDDPSHDALINGLQLVGDSLTHLAIEGDPYNIELYRIVESCPNLVSLVVDNVRVVMSSSSGRYPKMTHLRIYNVPVAVPSDDDVIDLLSRFPSLLSFDITPKPSSSVLTLLHEHCPYLQQLHYGCYSGATDEPDLHKVELHPNGKGITSAHLGNEGYDYDHDDLIQFLHLHRHSLEAIDFGCSNINDNDCHWKLENGNVVLQAHDHHRDMPTSLLPENDPTQTKTIFKRLVDVSFLNDDPSSSSRGFMLWLISNAPNLKAIHLTESHFLPDVSKAMIKMSHLSKLEITRVAGTAEYIDPIISLMQHHIAMEDQSTLEEIIIHIDGGNMDAVTWLGFISQMKRLKDLSLLTRVIPEDCLPALEKIGQGCSSLESLTLGTWSYRGSSIADGVIRSFRQHPNLKHLTIESKSLLATDVLALNTLPRLERLRLNYYTPDLVKDMLRRVLPNVIIE
ncbi:hypothetical protein O0I10_011736 [Lichtheimia ornata]|uniref:F-box domain-containing protein n=1 Tax=Lichtheimia ornata TaxID=688661 RepID=A0AAD7UUA0_9FUNG|nr:uncharacterized protein O0I10_011736 [Lichtheimia ornata]KAJ8652590.1 hypothetical protein O0I10_011736 [Lichtheimia ornata]